MLFDTYYIPHDDWISYNNCYMLYTYVKFDTLLGTRFTDESLIKNNPYPKGLKGEPKLSGLLKRIKDKGLNYFFGEVAPDLGRR